MKKFIIKTLFFTVPFFLLYTFNFLMYKNNDGDLARIGYFYSNPSPKELQINKYSLKRKYVSVSDLNLNTNNNFEVLNIGDSYSEQDSLSYLNFLVHQNVSVLHYNRTSSVDNNIQQLIDLTNGNFFESNKVNYVVLQCGERMFIKRTMDLQFNKVTNIDSLIKLQKIKKFVNEDNKIDFFSDAMFKIPLTNLEYLFKDKPIYSDTYKVESNKNDLFTNNPNSILFFRDDIDYLYLNNVKENIDKANFEINKINSILNKKNIKLILMIPPDKYSLYYKFIKNKNGYTKPQFFNYFNQLKKDYIYIDSYSSLSKAIENGKDVYYYDDTHWSPLGAKIVANELKLLIK